MNNATLVARVREQKLLARRNRTVRNLVLLLGVLTGLAPALVWLMVFPADKVMFMAGVAGGCLLGFLMLAKFDARLFPRKAACPTCGHDWEIREGNHVSPKEKMLDWDRCPGCGTLMNEVLLARKVRSGS